MRRTLPPLLLLLPAVLCSQPPADHFIRGSVVDSATKSPIENATILLALNPNGATEGRARTDSSGHFSIPGVAPGRYRLMVAATRYAVQAYGAAGPMEVGSELIVGGAKDPDIVVELSSAGEARGSVVDEEGAPIADVIVDLLERRTYRGAVESVPLGSRTTGPDGNYVFQSLAPGAFYLRLQRWARESEKKAETEGCLPNVLYYAGTPVANAAVSFTVTSGRTTDLGKLKMRRGPCASVRLKVESRETLPGLLEVGFAAADSTAISDPVTKMVALNGRSNTIEFPGLARGEYLLVVQDAGERTPVQIQRLAVYGTDVNQTVMIGSGQIRGHLRDIGTSGLTTEFPNEVSLESIVLTNWKRVAKVDPDGSFNFPGVGQGDYYLNFRGIPKGVLVRAVSVDGVESANHRLHHSGDTQINVEVSVQRGTAKVAGDVEGEHTGRTLPVILLPESPSDRTPDKMLLTVTSASGLFSFDAVPAGRYRLLALEGLKWGEGINPEFVAQFASSGTEVEVEEHASLNVRARVIRTR